MAESIQPKSFVVQTGRLSTERERGSARLPSSSAGVRTDSPDGSRMEGVTGLNGCHRAPGSYLSETAPET